MADYGAFPLWREGGAFMIGRDALPLPHEVRIALAEWSRFYDETLSSNEYQWPSEEVERSFVERGRILAGQVASALGTEYSVLYFNDETGEREPI
jgi:hypothetical protein